MGLMDKFKNLFTDEEIIDEEEENESIEIKEIKKEEEHKLPTFMREKIEREQQEKEQKIAQAEAPHSENIEVKELKVEEKISEPVLSNKAETKPSFKFPMDLSDNDFIETRSRQSIHNVEKKKIPSKPKIEVQSKREVTSVVSRKETKVSDLYKDKKEEKKEVKHFKATPIISPIYGVLDQNYTSGDVEKNKGDNLEHHRHSKNVDFDSVRKKAYGNISKEIKENLMCENCEYLKEAKECKRKQDDDSSDYDVVYDEECRYQNESENTYSDYDDTIKNYDNITLDEATENYYDYGVAYDKSNYEPPEEVKIVTHDEVKEHPKKEIPPVKSSINLLSTLKKSMGDEESTHSVVKEEKKEKNLELTDDLFNLIDSMYDERNGGE